MRQPHLKHTQVIRLSRILNMMYKPSELAEEIGVSQETIHRSYLPAGMPHERDRRISESWIDLLQPARESKPMPQLQEHRFYPLDEVRAIATVAVEILREARARLAVTMLFLSGMRPDVLASISQNVMHSTVLITDQVYAALTDNQVQNVISTPGQSRSLDSREELILQLIERLRSQL